MRTLENITPDLHRHALDRTWSQPKERTFGASERRRWITMMTTPRRDGRTCDECGAPNLPPGWGDRSWSRYVDPSLDRGEGFSGLVLCVLCFAERVEQQAGAEEALAVLKRAFRRHQERVATMREPRS